MADVPSVDETPRPPRRAILGALGVFGEWLGWVVLVTGVGIVLGLVEATRQFFDASNAFWPQGSSGGAIIIFIPFFVVLYAGAGVLLGGLLGVILGAGLGGLVLGLRLAFRLYPKTATKPWLAHAVAGTLLTGGLVATLADPASFEKRLLAHGLIPKIPFTEAKPAGGQLEGGAAERAETAFAQLRTFDELSERRQFELLPRRANQGPKVRVLFDCDDSNAPRIRSGQRVQLRTPEQVGRVFEGRVSHVALHGTVADVTAEFEDPEGGLKPSQGADASIVVGSRTALFVPNAVLSSESGGSAVVYVIGDSPLPKPAPPSLSFRATERRSVRLGVPLGDELREVLTGLRERDWLVLSGSLRDDGTVLVSSDAR